MDAVLDTLTNVFIEALSMKHLTVGPARGLPEIPPGSTNQLPFTLQVNSQIWPDFDKGDMQEAMKAAGTRFLDFINSLAVQWARGASVTESQFGVPRFSSGPSQGLEPDMLPPLLYDLASCRVVRSVDLGRVDYIAISHVWGCVDEVDGRKYGVDWNIPVRSEAILNQILEAARVVGGSRFVWMDILCMDQRQRNVTEIPLMKSYFANATGCLVWLDNAFNEPHWLGVLDAIEHANRFYHLDRHGIPTMSAMEMIGPNGVLNDMTISEHDIVRWIRHLMQLEKAPWFKRVWTLQEAVIPNRLHFCTPERYMVQEYTLFMTTAICEMLAYSAMEKGSVSGTCMIQLLQNTEVYKLLKLRQAYRKDQLGYWHLAQALRTRECKYEQDRVYGIYGLLTHPLPPIDYTRNLDSLNKDLFHSYISAGDLTPIFFLGGPSSLLPSPTSSTGLLTPKPTPTDPHTKTTFSLSTTSNNLTMSNIAIDPILTVSYIGITVPSSPPPSHPLHTIPTIQPHFLQIPTTHASLATAFSLPLTQHNSLYPSAYAAQSAPSILSSARNPMALMGPDFDAHFNHALPSALLTWTRLTFLAQERDVVFAVVTSEVSGSMLAVLTEPVPRERGACVLVMPGEYMETESGGEGCLVCVRVGDREEVRKIGVGLGRGVRGIGVIRRVVMVDS